MELPYTQYSQEFRKESVKFFKESDLTLLEAAKRLSLSKGTLKSQGETAMMMRQGKFLGDT